MPEDYNPFRQLEHTLRSLTSQSYWLFLEPMDDSLRESMRETIASTESDDSSTTTEVKTLIHKVLKPDTTDSWPDSEGRTPEPSVIPGIRNMDPMQAATLDSLRLRLRDCDRCALCRDRNKLVFGQGNIKADLVFIGEGPGADEDKSGIAFVGKAGKLLTQMIHSIGINRESVFICNIVKCRPPGNRNPTPDEINTCSPFLLKQLEILNPRLIVTLGNIATKTLLPEASGIMRMRGRLSSFRGIPLIPTFHPSYLLRNPSALELVWNDMKQIRQLLFQQESKTAAPDHE